MEIKELQQILNDVKNNVAKLVKGHDNVLTKTVCAFFSGGHLLLEDVPGTGKTTLAKALAKSLGMKFSRIQFTPDLMPSDITGVSIFNPKTSAFEFLLFKADRCDRYEYLVVGKQDRVSRKDMVFADFH